MFSWRRRTIILAVAILSILGSSFLKLGSTARSAQPQATADAPPELVLQTGHASGINAAVFGRGNKWVASGGADKVIKIWDTETGHELRALTGHAGWIKSFATDRDGKWLASGSNDLTIHVWDVTTGRVVYILKGHAKPIDALAFSSDGHTLASGGSDNTIRIWDLANGKETRTLTGHTGGILSLAFSNNGDYLVSSSADMTIKLWETKGWREVRTLKKHTAKVNAVAISTDGNWIVSGDADGVVCLWKMGSDRERFVMKHGASAALAVAFGQDGSIVVAQADGSLVSWDPATGKQRQAILGSGAEELVFASLSADATLIASSTGSRTVALRSQSGATIRTLASHSTGLKAVDLSKDGRWIASGADDGAVRLWQIATGREMPRLFAHAGFVTSIAFSDDSRLLATASRSGEVKIWDLTTQSEALSLPRTQDGIDAVAFSPDGKFIATGGMQQSVQVWNLATRQARNLAGHTAEITSVAFSPKEPLLASGGRDKTVRLWNINTGAIVRTFDAVDSEINSLTFDSDGRRLAAAYANGTVTVWEVDTARALQTLAAHHGEVFTLKFSPDGVLLASGGIDRSLKLWDTKTDREVRTLTGPSESLNSVAFSNDGQWIISGSDDGSMTIWNVAAGEVAATLVSARDSDDWLVATPDGLFDGSPQSWDSILWRFTGDTFKASPVEAFFNEYYYPALLADILAGKKPKAAQNISKKDRRQPQISLSLEGHKDDEITTRNIKVKLEITEAPPDKERSDGSGARDLRLFRNGLLIKSWPEDILKGGTKQTIEVSVPVVAGDNHLTAYAFNRDNVKSSDAKLLLTGADNLKRVGTAYVLAIGVGQYENAQYNLNYTVADAAAVGQQLKTQQEQLGHYNPVLVVPLSNQNATKANILLALQRLAGDDTGPLPVNAPTEIARIKAAQPEDAVVIYFSGHGTADKDRFFLIPHDLGYKGPRKELDSQGLQNILAHSISDMELEEALRSLDVDQLLLVIDACNSGQALNAQEKRRGPMNTRGLAQLAYEKGMYVLTAAQSDEVAFESEALKHSYLAYALVEEGIKSGAADVDHDGSILLREWFAYATERVPQIRREKRRRGKELEEVEADEEKVQRPRAFYTRDSGANRMVIAKLNRAKAQ